MALLERLQNDMKDAMKAGQKERLGTIRLLIAALKKERIDAMRELSDSDELDLLSREAKRRNESIEAFEKGGRQDLADKERGELDIIMLYMPQQLSVDEARALIRESIAESGAKGKADIGKLMKVLMPKLKGRFPSKDVRPLVDAELG